MAEKSRARNKGGFIWGGALIASLLTVGEEGESWTGSWYADRPTRVTLKITSGAFLKDMNCFFQSKNGRKTSGRINDFVRWGQLLRHRQGNCINVQFNKPRKCGVEILFANCIKIPSWSSLMSLVLTLRRFMKFCAVIYCMEILEFPFLDREPAACLRLQGA